MEFSTETGALASLGEAALAAGPAMSRLSSALERFGYKVYELAWDAYIKVGAPYGETHEGLVRWIEEQRTTIEE